MLQNGDHITNLPASENSEFFQNKSQVVNMCARDHGMQMLHILLTNAYEYDTLSEDHITNLF